MKNIFHKMLTCSCLAIRSLFSRIRMRNRKSILYKLLLIGNLNNLVCDVLSHLVDQMVKGKQ